MQMTCWTLRTPMSLIDRFLGQPDAHGKLSDLVANPGVERPLNLRVLFPAEFDFEDAATIQHSLRSLDEVLEKARVETVRLPESLGELPGQSIGLAGFGPHVVQMVHYAEPVPPSVFEACVRYAPFVQQLKDDAAQHQCHVVLSYAGEYTDPLEQYTVLTTIAAALARLDAILVINDIARAAFPAEALLATDAPGNFLQSLRTLPIPMLYGGFTKIELEAMPGVWMRTFANHTLNLPNLAYLADSHDAGHAVFDLFTNILNYARERGLNFEAGETINAGDLGPLTFRERTQTEWWLESEGSMLVLGHQHT
jgi:hypothetical protein